MSDHFELGAPVRHLRWGSIGTVVAIERDNGGLWIFVQWRDSAVEDQLRPTDLEVMP